MSKRFVGTLASAALMASVAWGQGQSNQWTSELKPSPAPEAVARATAKLEGVGLNNAELPELFAPLPAEVLLEVGISKPAAEAKADTAKPVTVQVKFNQDVTAVSPPSAVPSWEPVSSCAPMVQPVHQIGRAFTVDLDYLLWFLANSSDSAVIATTNPLGSPGVVVLGSVGDAEHARNGPTSGGRLKLGYWQIEDNPWIPSGIRDFGGEAVFFFVGQRSVDVVNDQTPSLVRPFFDLNNRQESGFIVAMPGLATGTISGHAQANMWGAEANVWKNIYFNSPGTTCNIDLMAGFRFLNANEDISISSTTVYNAVLPAASPFFPFAGNRLDVFDSFSTHNRFYGGQIGIAGKSYPIPNLCFELDFKLGLGVTSEDVNIVGSQVRTFANSTTAHFNSGLLALASNSGQFHQDRFSQVPELDFKISYDIMEHVSFSTGFTTLYWSRIARAGQQIDREIDITQIPNFPPAAGATPTGLGRPAVPFVQSDLWLLGFSLGLEIKW